MPELHTPPQEIFPTLALLFPWSLTFLQILEPRIHSDMGQGWAEASGTPLKPILCLWGSGKLLSLLWSVQSGGGGKEVKGNWSSGTCWVTCVGFCLSGLSFRICKWA